MRCAEGVVCADLKGMRDVGFVVVDGELIGFVLVLGSELFEMQKIESVLCKMRITKQVNLHVLSKVCDSPYMVTNNTMSWMHNEWLSVFSHALG